MGYTTTFKGILKFKKELNASQLSYLKNMIEETKDREMDIELSKDFSGLQWNGTEKTYDLIKDINFIINNMKEKYSDFELIEKLKAQGEEFDDIWELIIKDGKAVKKELIVTGKEITCPHCEKKSIAVMCVNCEEKFTLNEESIKEGG